MNNLGLKKYAFECFKILEKSKEISNRMKNENSFAIVFYVKYKFIFI